MDLPHSDPKFGKPVRCPQCYKPAEDQTKQRINAALEQQITPLTPFEHMIIAARLIRTPGNAQAINATERIWTEDGKKQITLTGAPGVGKTTILIATVNAAREEGRIAAYAKIADIFTWLRASFGKNTEDLDTNTIWKRLLAADLLALDELEKWQSTEWTNDIIQQLLDTRYRLAMAGTHATLYATNIPISSQQAPVQILPPNIMSRLRDNRIGQVISVYGNDMRQGGGR